MWWAGSRRGNALDVYLGTRAAGIGTADGQTSFEVVEGLDAALDAARGLLGSTQPRRPLRLWLSGALCQPFMLPPLQGAQGREEVERIAAAAAGDSTSLGSSCEVWLHAESSDAGTLVAAVPQGLPARIVEAFAGLGRPVSLRPWWGEVMRSQLAQPAPGSTTIGVQDCDALVVLSGVGDGFDFATAITPLAGVEESRAAWARMLMAREQPPETSRLLRLALDDAPAGGIEGCAFGQRLEVLA